MVVRALEGVGYRPEILALDCLNRVPLHSCPVLEGDLHSLWFEEHASTTLSLDLSLTLRNPVDDAPFWAAEIPQDSTCPVWIGIGCTVERGIDAAFATLVDDFRQIFMDREFAGGIANNSNRSTGSHAGRS